jgi:tRNA A-37 threonylcarbamoyl transferase component Bud32
MTRCHECDSEVAELDEFCPFCGISLRVDSVPQEEADDSMASTIMMANPKPAQPAKADEPDTPIADQIVSMDDIPVPTILNELSKTSDNIVPQSTSDFSLEGVDIDPKSAESEKDASPVDLVIEPSVPVPPFESALAIEAAAVDDENATTEPSVELPEMVDDAGFGSQEPVITPIDDLVSAEPVRVSSPFETEPGKKVTESDFVADESESAKADAPSTVSDAPSAVSNEDDLYKARSPFKDESISKPPEELDLGDSFSPPSVFDSVRIMENKGAQDYVDTQIKTGHVYRPDEVSEPISSIEPVPVAAEPRPQTAPSMGIGDTDGRRTAKLKPLTEGTILNGRYEIVRKIGGGGMGAVYLASDNNLGGVLRAVKEMVQAHIEEEQQDKAINDFKRESMILSTLDHASIPTIYDYFYDETESRFYLVMKYISGGDLSSRLRSAPEGKIDEVSVTEWAIQIIDVLDYLHNQPSTIVYRDLKPSNIMMDGNSGRIMLIDFGIARSISQKEEKGVTAVGTMGYAPPELFSGNVEPRSDIYSLGSTMFHLLTGADPQSNPLLIFDFQKNPRPRQINPQLSDQIERILMRSVEYSADARFKNAAEMRKVLEDHLTNLKTGNLTYGVTEAPASVSLANQTVFCGFCGQRIVATDLFCAFCGAKQPIAQQGVHAEIYTKSVTAQLVIEGTSELATPAFSLQKDETLLGRRDPMSNIFPEVDLSKYDPQTKISRRHARIWRDGTTYMVEDLGSSNGTVLATAVKDAFRLVPHQPQVLSSGDKIKIGDTTLHFVVG